MNNTMTVFTPEQTAEILQLSKNTIYELINRGEIVAKKIGKVYRIPLSSLSFVVSGLDNDLLQAQKQDEKNINKIQDEIKKIRSYL
ncbi:MAG: helix-turn-helix domain-containing protein [bacterium]|nr:helix-turn-helix domain-containing protein [bacterium]